MAVFPEKGFRDGLCEGACKGLFPVLFPKRKRKEGTFSWKKPSKLCIYSDTIVVEHDTQDNGLIWIKGAFLPGFPKNITEMLTND